MDSPLSLSLRDEKSRNERSEIFAAINYRNTRCSDFHSRQNLKRFYFIGNVSNFLGPEKIVPRFRLHGLVLKIAATNINGSPRTRPGPLGDAKWLAKIMKRQLNNHI